MFASHPAFQWLIFFCYSTLMCLFWTACQVLCLKISTIQILVIRITNITSWLVYLSFRLSFSVPLQKSNMNATDRERFSLFSLFLIEHWDGASWLASGAERDQLCLRASVLSVVSSPHSQKNNPSLSGQKCPREEISYSVLVCGGRPHLFSYSREWDIRSRSQLWEDGKSVLYSFIFSLRTLYWYWGVADWRRFFYWFWLYSVIAHPHVQS